MRTRRRAVALAVAGAISIGSFLSREAVAEDVVRADPLEVPAGPLPEPETWAAEGRAPSLETLERTASDLRARGLVRLPFLAWAALDDAAGTVGAGALARARDLDEQSPGTLFEIALRTRRPSDLGRALLSLKAELSAIAWIGVVLFVAGASASVLVALVLVGAGFARSLPLHGHAIGHWMCGKNPPKWPGVLVVLGILSVLALVGIGPLLWLGLVGVIAASRLPRLEGAVLAAALIWIGVFVGPGLEAVSRAALIASREVPLRAAWRIDRSQPLPGDIDVLRHALDRRPEDLLSRSAASIHHLQIGDLEAVESLVTQIPSNGSPALRAHALSQLGAVHLARGDVLQAMAAFEEVRRRGESAAVLFNLSQAYGRAIRLSEQSELFTAARELDPKLVSERSAVDDRNLHGHLIRWPIPLEAYAREAFAPSREARALAGALRERAVGASLPAWMWIAPGLGTALAVLFRRSGLRRCVRCGRHVCEDCSPGAEGESCLRCVHLFTRASQIDVRVRQRELALDRRRQIRSDMATAVAGLLLPGVSPFQDGRPIRGAVRTALWGLGAGLVVAAWLVPPPWEVGRFGMVLPVGLGALLLVPSYLASMVESVRRIAPWRSAG